MKIVIKYKITVQFNIYLVKFGNVRTADEEQDAIADVNRS